MKNFAESIMRRQWFLRIMNGRATRHADAHSTALRASPSGDNEIAVPEHRKGADPNQANFCVSTHLTEPHKNEDPVGSVVTVP
jgi:hypothetical protein